MADQDEKLPVVIINGQQMKLGNKPKPRGLMLAAPMHESLIIDRAQWVPSDIRDQRPFKKLNQGQAGACNTHAGVEVLMAERWRAGIEPHVDLSPWFPYGMLTGGRDIGSSIAELLSFLTTTGTCENSLVPYGQFNPKKFSDAAEADAANYKIEVGARLTSFDAMMSATMRGRLFNFSLDGNQMSGVDAKGRIGSRAGTGNHALSGGWGMLQIDGVWYGIGLNHWGDWGMDNEDWFLYQESNIKGQRYFDAYEMIAAADSPNGNNPLPAVA